MRSSVLAAVLALLQEGSANTARGAHSPIVTPDTRLNPAAQTPTCGDGAALRLRGGSREDRPLKLHHLPRSGLLTAELLGLLALKIFDVMESRSSGAAPSLISRRDVFVAAILVIQYACWQVVDGGVLGAPLK